MIEGSKGKLCQKGLGRNEIKRLGRKGKINKLDFTK